MFPFINRPSLVWTVLQTALLLSDALPKTSLKRSYALLVRARKIIFDIVFPQLVRRNLSVVKKSLTILEGSMRTESGNPHQYLSCVCQFQDKCSRKTRKYKHFEQGFQKENMLRNRQ